AVSFIEVAKVNIHAVLVKIASGQLPFLGSVAAMVLLAAQPFGQRYLFGRSAALRRLPMDGP
ncbi:MAG: hypothetical protein FWG56_00695, partial [Desulfovibrionaceae bacterium]|nr:hypothetical protein [Desulfovibrionaceae bacterium]